MENKLSVVLAVYNEEQYLDNCLRSVEKLADEIIVVDGGSQDKTISIAQRYTNKIYRTDNPPIFHINKQKALDKASNEWILQLDADEIVTDELANEIKKTVSLENENCGYYIPRKNNFWGHFMKKTGVYPDYVIRLVKKQKARFPCKSVHEQIEIDGPIAYLTQPLLHYSYHTVADYWRKANHYTSLTANELEQKKVKKDFISVIRYCLFYPIKIFVVLFFRNQGFQDGIYGFLFSLFSGLHYPIAFWKYTNLIDKK